MVYSTCTGLGVRHFWPSQVDQANARPVQPVGVLFMDRFWENVNKRGPFPKDRRLGRCWEYEKLSTNGYGRIQVDGKRHQAHRFAWTLKHGAIPDGVKILHRCDNPPCVRHLFSGSQADNVRDMMSKGRKNPLLGQDHGMAKLTENQVLEIRRRYKYGSGAALAKEFGVKRLVVSRIVRRVSWKHLKAQMSQEK